MHTNHLLNFAIIVSLAGCAVSPPAPPKVNGEYRPVNQLSDLPFNSSIPRVFDFDYEGSLEGALIEIRKHQPQMRIEPSEGKRKVINIKISARQVTLENALQLVAREAKGVAEVVHRPDSVNKIDSILIRYK